MLYNSKLADFKNLISKIEMIDNTRNSLIYWDKITNMPPEGIEYRSKVMAYLAEEQYKLFSGREFAGYVKYFKDNKKNDHITDAMVRRIYDSSYALHKIPEKEYHDYVELFTTAEQIWEKAKKENQYEVIRPYWEKIFDYFRKFAEYWGYEGEPYDALMGYYEKGLTVEKMDEMVSEIKSVLIGFRKQIQDAAETEAVTLEDIPVIDAATQQKIWKMILSQLGFSFTAGRVDTGSHPTILSNSPSDVRIVSTCNEQDFRAGIFNILHAGGKGIYHQSIDKDLMGTFLADTPSWIFEEAIGRFYENIIGKSKGFWLRFYDEICEIAPQLKKYTACQLFKSVNNVEPGAVRLEADELSYLLHIIIRYEIEREIFKGKISTEDIPEIWNKKYEDYLGVKPANDSEGVLQDIHWSAGYVGYFPTYLLAELMAAQIKSALEEACGDLDQLISEGRFEVINKWLKENIFKHGAIYTNAELLVISTGKGLDSVHYIDYLRNKFSEVYKTKL
ncbi:MAG: carboxypeptidase M32 [Firmicutes bacterium]|nr:carboxypeptidase M32 [Bacillota bacterium]